MSKKQVITHHSKDFYQGVGKHKGEYHICRNKDVIPIQHSPQQVLVALRNRLKETLNSLITQGIIIPVTQLIPWINSIAVVPKKDCFTANFPWPKRSKPWYSERTLSITTYWRHCNIASRWKCLLFWMYVVGFGMSHLLSSQLTTFHTTLEDIDGTQLCKISVAENAFWNLISSWGVSVLNVLIYWRAMWCWSVEVVASNFVAIGFGDTFKEVV